MASAKNTGNFTFSALLLQFFLTNCCVNDFSGLRVKLQSELQIQTMQVRERYR